MYKRQAVDSFQHDLFQHYIADIVYLKVSSAAFVVGAAVMLLIGVKALGTTLTSTITLSSICAHRKVCCGI